MRSIEQKIEPDPETEDPSTGSSADDLGIPFANVGIIMERDPVKRREQLSPLINGLGPVTQATWIPE